MKRTIIALALMLGLREPPGGGRRQQIRVDLSALMNGTAEDIPLVDDDVIIVPREIGAKSKEKR